MKFHAIGDSSRPNTLLKQEGLQLAEASFRDQNLSLEWEVWGEISGYYLGTSGYPISTNLYKNLKHELNPQNRIQNHKAA